MSTFVDKKQLSIHEKILHLLGRYLFYQKNMEPEIQFTVGDTDALHIDRLKMLENIVQEAKNETGLSPSDFTLLQKAMAEWVEDSMKWEALYDEE